MARRTCPKRAAQGASGRDARAYALDLALIFTQLLSLAWSDLLMVGSAFHLLKLKVLDFLLQLAISNVIIGSIQIVLDISLS